jgi:hypothetical protein
MTTSNPAMVKLVDEHKYVRNNELSVESSIPREALVLDHEGTVLLWRKVPYYRGRGRGRGKTVRI